MKKVILTFFAVVAALSLSSCHHNATPEDNDNEMFSAIAEQYIKGTVLPTYTNLAAQTQNLVDALVAFRASKTQANLEKACTYFLDARAWWEKSEAFLFGAAADFGIDPHIDSWPLDLTALQNALSNEKQVAAMDDEDGDVYAGEQLGNAVLGFHGIEYILFENGAARTASSISDLNLIYAIAVAGDLRNRTWELEVAWAGEGAPASHIERVEDDLELNTTLSNGNYYGENFLSAGKAGSLYASLTAAMDQILAGADDIVVEVGTSKIGKPYSGEDETYIESPYSQKSITDFYNNIISVQNAYMGGLEGARNESASLHKYFSENAPAEDAQMVAAINEALSKINSMKAPFVNNMHDTTVKAAIDALDNLDKAIAACQDALER